jgi:hypothetical protein
MLRPVLTLIFLLALTTKVVGTIEVNYTIPVNLDDYDLRVDHGTTKIIMPEGFNPAPAGEPELLWAHIFASGEAVADFAHPIIEVLRADTIQMTAPLCPTPTPTETRDVDARPSDVSFPTAKSALSEYPAENCRIESSTWRGLPVLSVSWCPFRYNPVTNQLIAIREGEIHFATAEDTPGLRAASPPIVQLGSYKDLRHFPGISPILPERSNSAGAAQVVKTGAPLGVEYVIVTSAALAAAFTPLAQWRLQQGYRAGIADVEQIALSFPGPDLPAKIRAYLAEAYAGGLQFCVLGGDESVVPIRYAYHSYTDEMPGYDRLQICDLYYADFTGDWDADGDGVYGEYLQDDADLLPEIYVGRLPAANAAQVTAIVDKLIAYEANPGAGDASYVTRALFTCSDQMRDWDNGAGQHKSIAEQFPAEFDLDLESQAENPNGSVPDPQSPEGAGFINHISSGWGWTTLINHGRTDGFILRAAGLNQNPKSYIWSDGAGGSGNGSINMLPANHRPGIFLSVACDGGAIDMDGPLFGGSWGTNTSEALLQQPGGGAVAVMAYSRWGWVASSYRVIGKIVEYAFDPAHAPQLGAAFALAKASFPYYRDQNLGLNLYGDPAMRHWTARPKTIDAVFPEQVRADSGPVQFSISDVNGPLAGAVITATCNDTVFYMGETDGAGIAVWTTGPPRLGGHTITITRPGHLPYIGQLIVPIATDILEEEDETGLMQLALGQNYPNPFNPTTTIEFSLPDAGDVRLDVYDILGRHVTTLLECFLAAGKHRITYEGTDDHGSSLPSGVYFYRLQAGQTMQLKKMVMLK